MQVMKHILAFSLVFAMHSASATEVDNFTSYYQPLAESEARLNAMVQRKIDAVLSSASTCDLKKMGKNLGYQLVGNLFFGTIEAEVVEDPTYPRIDTPVSQSIYRGTPYEPSIVGRLVNLGSIMNIGGHRIGTDKVGHFFDMGYDLYWREKKGAKIEDIVHRSRHEQQGLWGKWMTGVKSYGDIAANFDGYRFWRDVFGDGPNPYFTCENGRLKQIREFRWIDYANSAWNEAINCSDYSSQSYNTVMTANVMTLEKRSGRRYTCPIDRSLCEPTRQRYRQFVPEHLVKEIVSPLCI